MDVLELPRPVINFLRTMAKEGCRYVLSWDIFGGNDAITLTLTWKSNEEEEEDQPLELLKTPLEQVNDELHTRRNDSTSSPRRSRRDETTTAAAIFRSSRGKSLENPPHQKGILSHPSFISSFERSSIITREKKDSDPIYANLSHLKHANHSSPSRHQPIPSNNPSTYQRTIKQAGDTSILRKVTPIINENYSKLKRMNLVNRDDDDDDDTSDPWIKRLDPSHDNHHTGKSDDEIDKSVNPSGKVKFKRKPDYF